MKTILGVCLLLFLLNWNSSAQRTFLIDYSKDSLLNPNCIFNSGPRVIQNFWHEPSRGKILYSVTQKSIELLSSSTGEFAEKFDINEYAIAFNFKRSFNYTISASTKTTAVLGVYKTTLWHKLSNTKGESQGCDASEIVYENWFSNNSYGYYILQNTAAFEEKSIYSGIASQNYSYILISASPSTSRNAALKNQIYKTSLKNIKIVESSGLNISPLNTTVVCDDTQPVTYTINNPNNIDYHYCPTKTGFKNAVTLCGQRLQAKNSLFQYKG